MADFGDPFGVQQMVDDLSNQAAKVLGKANSAINSSSAKNSTPWQALTPTPFLAPINIDPDRWNLLFPYRLLVIDVTDGNRVVVADGSQNSSRNDSNADLKIVNAGVNGVFSILFTPLSNKWIYQLPITPEQLNIQDQFSINTTATLRGVLEEHNGVKFKIISASGSLGVWLSRSSVVDPPTSPTPIQSVFGGTIDAFGSLASQVQGVINTATTGHPANAPQTKQPANTPEGNTSTGYYQALALQQFLEQYAEAKKNPANLGWRLVFDIPKQNQSFVVTPMQFIWQQQVNKPLDVKYSLQFKAWRRIDLHENVFDVPPAVQTVDAGLLQRIQNTITQARIATSAAINLIGAVRSDVETPLDVLRQTSLLVKDLAGAVVTAADLPFQLQRDYKSAISSFLTSLSINNLVPSTSSDPAVANAINSLKASAASREGLSIDSVSNGQLGNTASNSQSIDPALNVFSQPEANFNLMNQVPINSLKLTAAQQNKVNDVLTSARELTVDDLKTFRATIQQLALQLSNNFGAGDAFYNQVYGLPAPTVRLTPMTVDDYDILKALYDAMQSYDSLTATTQIDDENQQTNMDYVAGLAQSAGIEFETSSSKVLLPVPFGLTVEAISQRYLGDPQRWLEIVTLNNLKDPYIDEDGFQLELLSNATGRQITVSSDQNLYLGQRVILQSSTQTPAARAILEIDQLSDTSFLLTLDGAPNLDNFKIADGALLQAYLPGTVNSQQKIFVPSNLPVSNDPNIIVPSSTSGDPLTGLSKVDWLLTDAGDLAVNNYGDFRLSYGMTNIIQALKIKLGTVQGSVLLHPEFGAGIKPGTINADISAKQIYSNINKLIQQDPRFDGVSTLQISVNGPVLTINLGVILANNTGVFPITFQTTP
jgi:hypothetical protein